MGVGNRIKGDDALGPVLMDRLASRITIPIINAEDVPENYLGPLESSGADLVLIVDAADFKGSPGEVRLIEMDDLAGQALSTHTADLSLLFQAIPAGSRPEGVLIGIQPGSMDFLTGLSDPVLRSLDVLEKELISLFPPGPITK
jgi:hydrogenase 3 maturation protease